MGLLGKSVDNIIHQVDIDHVVRQIDVDDVVNRVDVNRVIERVDLDRVIARIDMDALIDRIDFEKIVDKSNLEAIVARSSSGLCLQFFDLVRIRVVALDLFVHRMARGRCCQFHDNVPASPEQRHIRPQQDDNSVQTRRERAAARIVEVQGCFSGVVSRAVSWLLDELFVLGTFGLGTLVAEEIARLVNKGRGFQHDNVLLVTILYAIWGALYRIISLLLTRRTLGMLALGLKLVNRHGQKPSAWQILVRQALQPWLSIFFFIGGPAFIVAWQRQDGRFVHDLLTGTGYVYSWDVRMAKIRLSQTDESVLEDVEFELGA